MLSTCITNISVKPGRVGDVLRLVERDLLPRYRELPGFVAYTVAKMDDTSAIAFSLWQTHEQAEHYSQRSERGLYAALAKRSTAFTTTSATCRSSLSWLTSRAMRPRCRSAVDRSNPDATLGDPIRASTAPGFTRDGMSPAQRCAGLVVCPFSPSFTKKCANRAWSRSSSSPGPSAARQARPRGVGANALSALPSSSS